MKVPGKRRYTLKTQLAHANRAEGHDDKVTWTIWSYGGSVSVLPKAFHPLVIPRHFSILSNP